MQCQCKPKLIVPVQPSVAQAYWGYIHATDKQIHVKRWFTINTNVSICDRCAAEEDYVLQREDPLILWICPYPIYALNNDQAGGILIGIYQGVLDENTWFNKPNRFVDLLDELYTT